VIKKIFKDKLVTNFLKEQARQEFPLHCSLNHTNIIKGLEWSENDDEYILVMECSNRPNYLKDKIQEVSLCKRSFINTTVEANSNQK